MNSTFGDGATGFAVLKYKNHPSIITITENASFESWLRFKNVSENNVQKRF